MQMMLLSTLAMALFLTPDPPNAPVSNSTSQIEKIREKISHADDCVVSVINTPALVRIETRNGKKLEVYRDGLKRASLIVSNGRSFRLRYDQEVPTRVAGIFDQANNRELPVPDGLKGAIPAQVAKALSNAGDRLMRCKY